MEGYSSLYVNFVNWEEVMKKSSGRAERSILAV